MAKYFKVKLAGDGEVELTRITEERMDKIMEVACEDPSYWAQTHLTRDDNAVIFISNKEYEPDDVTEEEFLALPAFITGKAATTVWVGFTDDDDKEYVRRLFRTPQYAFFNPESTPEEVQRCDALMCTYFDVDSADTLTNMAKAMKIKLF